MANGRFDPLDFLMNAVSVTALLAMLALMGVQSQRVVSEVTEARGRQYFAAMRAALADVEVRQVLYYRDMSEFADTPEALGLSESDGVVIALARTDDGWAAAASHSALGLEHGCWVFFGDATASAPAARPTAPGQVACTTD